MSLRMRLTLIILLPLLAIATATGFWHLETARQTAASVFERSMLSAAFAVSNDVTLSEGDALSPRTREILADTSGGPVFYHVYAPDGVIVAGYATPPVGIPRTGVEEAGPTYFDAVYMGRPVSGVRVQNRTQIDGFSGIFTTTVWQDTAVRDAFVQNLAFQSLATIGGLIATVALVVWFGVRLGLRPLLSLQEAIERRSSDELSPIRRPVPVEARGIVERLNRLLSQVASSLTAQSEFISNAAHQLRNPIAGVLSLAEAVHSAPSPEQARSRARDLLDAARETADLTQKLLTIERAKTISPASLHEQIDLGACLQEWLPGFHPAGREDVAVRLRLPDGTGSVRCDPTMVREALVNLVDNAVRHGGPSLTRIQIAAERAGQAIRLSVADDGRGIASNDVPRASERFSQLAPGDGSGLGLPIVAAIAEAHGGSMAVTPLDQGVEVSFTLANEARPGGL